MGTSNVYPIADFLDKNTEGMIREAAAAARREAAKELHSHLLQSINNVDRSDIAFICKDGDKVYDSRSICMRQSEKLDAMLKSGVWQARFLTVTVPDIHSQALLSILEYFSTGNIIKYRPLNCKAGHEVLAAARFLMLPSFKMKALEKILSQIVGDPGMDLEQAAFLTVAVESMRVLE